MPKINLNKNRGVRIKYIDEAIASGRYPDNKKLSYDYDIKPATLSRDIEYMRDVLRAPIEYDYKRKGYYYSKKGYRLPAAYASAEDLLAIEFIKELTETYRDNPIHSKINEFLKTVAVPKDIEKESKWYKDRIVIPKAMTMSVPVDQDVWDCLITGLKENRIVSFDYFSASPHASIKYGGSKIKLSRRTVRPYQLLYDRSAWYLLGYDEDREEKRMYSAARISNASVTDKKFTLKGDFDIRNYEEKNFFGLFPYIDVYKFVIEIFGDTSWVKEKKWADDQKIKETENGITLSFSSHQFDKVLDFVLSLGSNARPVEPELLVVKWKEILKDMVALIADP